jgi:tetratricopeptide (TPR) repeat protein
MFKTAVWRNEENADAHYQLAFTFAYRVEYEHLERGEVDSARIKTKGAFDHYVRAAELNPDKYAFNPEAEDDASRTPSATGIRSLYARMFNEGVRLQSDDPEQATLYFELAGLADPRGAAGFDAKYLVYQLEYNNNQGDEAAIREVLAKTNSLEVGDDWVDSTQKRADLVGFKATMHRALGEDAMAGRLYEGLLQSDPENVTLMRRVAETRRTQSDYAGATDLYVQALAIADASPLDYSVDERYGLAISAADAARQGELYDRCIELATQAMGFATSNQQRSDASRTIARSWYELEEFDNAIVAIEPVLLDGGYEPTSLDGWQIYYLSLNQVGRVEEATQARDRFQALQGSR